MDEQRKLTLAKRRVEALTGFYIHLAVFAFVILLLLVINVFSAGSWWVQWPFLGWGAGIAGHAWTVFGEMPGFIRRWQSSKINEISQKL